MKRVLANWLQYFPPLRWGLKLGVKLLMPSHHVGAVGVVFNSVGQVLLLEHVFRPNHTWGLPGGWVERGENPADTVRREYLEELGLKVEVTRLLLCQVQGNEPQTSIPRGLGLAYYCRLVEDTVSPVVPTGKAYEILSTRWIAPQEIAWQLSSLENNAIALARQEFEREQEKS